MLNACLMVNEKYITPQSGRSESARIIAPKLLEAAMPNICKLSSITIAAASLVTTAAPARTVSIPFSPANFSHPLDTTNTYFPLIAGTTFTSKADTHGGCEVDVTTVTYDTRVIDGVTTRVVHDQVFDGDTCTTAPEALTEETFDYYAQDD